LARLERLLRDLVKADPACRLMMTMPSIGPVVAMTIWAAIDDPFRFRSSKDIGPWAGLTPSRHQSGERDVIGAISRAGDASARVALFQAATVMLCRGAKNWLTAWAQRVAARRGRKRATVALARKIGVVLHRMWCDGTEFRFTRAADIPTAVS
jgi:transposase